MKLSNETLALMLATYLEHNPPGADDYRRCPHLLEWWTARLRLAKLAAVDAAMTVDDLAAEQWDALRGAAKPDPLAEFPTAPPNMMRVSISAPGLAQTFR